MLEESAADKITLCATEDVENENCAKEYPTVVAWLSKHKFVSSLVASLAVAALSSVAVVAAATKR